ncbi:MAG: tRNA (adenosine(37)-N6)-threonylcarbamoyltransferase complex dimerization subunit type 1 TsaB, partial [Bacteroidales bacterium]|nr:tRNA (adenosine(37)-N6)-threonylcarbamoyltransferase complex dimerization subunit type 1 TsaB [Bacteroidales bacterium]
GALKCREVLSAAFPDAAFVEVLPHADAMAPLAERAFSEGRFEDPAYFEPFYLKQFVATLPRKTLF